MVVRVSLHAFPPWLDAVLDAMGGTLVGTALVAVAYEVFVRRNQQELVETAMRSLLQDQLALLRSQVDEQRNFTKLGLERILTSFSLRTLLEALEPGDKLWMLDTYDRQYQTWMEEMDDALSRGAEIYVLIVDPGAAVAEMRAAEIGETQAFSGVVHVFGEVLRRLQRKHRSNLKVRYYADLPCAPMYLVERDGKFFRGYTSYFLDVPSNGEFPHFQWSASESSAGGVLGSHFLSYVVSKWERAGKPWTSAATPTGQWIYTFTVRGEGANESLPVYGIFSIYRQRQNLIPQHESFNYKDDYHWEDHAEGEAFYVGCRPDSSSERRGFWRSTKIICTNKDMTVHYDMVIQRTRPISTAPDATGRHNDDKADNCYRGLMVLSCPNESQCESLFDGLLVGQINDLRDSHNKQPQPILGTVRAKRLVVPISRKQPDIFSRELHKAFLDEFRLPIFEEADLPAVESAVSEENSSILESRSSGARK